MMKQIKFTKKNINFIKENKEIINEIASGKLYHFTSISNALKIAEENCIYFQSAIANISDQSYSHKKLFYLSTTRTRYQSFGYSRKFSNNSARIELNGDKINQIATAKPFAYWNSDIFGKQQYLKNDNNGLTKDKQEHVNDEAEDRIYTNISSYKNAAALINRIDIILTDYNDKNDYNYIECYNLLNTPLRNKIYIYNNLKDFNAQNNNTINNIIKNDYDSYGKANKKSVFDTNISFRDINVLLATILNGETKNYKTDAALLLKKYNLDKYLKNGILKKDNEYTRYPYNINYYELIELSSDVMLNFSRKPTEDKSKLLQMMSDYFVKNKLKNYQDYIKHKSIESIITPNRYNYTIIKDLIDKKYVDGNKTIHTLLIRQPSTYDYIIVYNPNIVHLSLFTDDYENIAYSFISATEDNMKSKDYNSYVKYIVKYFAKNPTIGDIINLLKKLNYNNIAEMLENILNIRVIEKDMNIYDIETDYIMPNCLKNKEKNLAEWIKLFKI